MKTLELLYKLQSQDNQEFYDEIVEAISEIESLQNYNQSLKSELEETKARHIYLKHVETEAELSQEMLRKIKEEYKLLELDYKKQFETMSCEIEEVKITEFNRGVKECFDFITGIAANTDDIIKSNIIQDTAEYMLETMSPSSLRSSHFVEIILHNHTELNRISRSCKLAIISYAGKD